MSHFKLNRSKAIAKKEFFHILRDPFTLSMAFILPLFVVFIFGYAMEFNQKNVDTAYLDMDKTPSSRFLLEKMKSGGYFRLKEVLSTTEGFDYVKSNQAKAFLVIPPDFDKSIQSGIQKKVQLLIDGTDSSAAGIINKYLNKITSDVASHVNVRRIPNLIKLKVRYLFNPELNSKWFSIPGIAGVIMGILCILLTSLTVAREWEKGSMELLLSTPVRPLEIILGKLIPYACISLGSVFIVYVLARLWFDIPFRGSHLIFILCCVVFLLGYLALGLVISVVLRQQLTAMQAAMIVGLLPTNLLSGFIFPVENMPIGFRWFASVFPVRWFMVTTRDQFLKGSDFFQLSTPFFAMGGVSVILVIVALIKFKGDLD